MRKISVIVPIYNTEEYLPKCLDSLINQTLEDIEIILVSDASPDNSSSIMEEYRRNHPELIKCIYLEENIFQGGARNKGLEIATGEYVTFVDSDDSIDLTFCEKLYKKALSTNSDIVGCDYNYVIEETGEIRWNSIYFIQQTGEMDKDKRKSLFLMFPFPVAKIIRRSMLIDNNLYFPIRMKYEDNATVPLYFFYAERMELVQEPLYDYMIRKRSTSRISDWNVQRDILKAAEYLNREFQIRGIMNDYAEEAKGLYIRSIMTYLMKITTLFQVLPFEGIRYIESEVKNLYPEAMDNPYYFVSDAIGRKVARLIKENKTDELLQEHMDGVTRVKDVGYRLYYRTFAAKIDKLFRYCDEQQYKVAIWGAGVKGNDFLEECDSDRLRVDHVIDLDVRKHGKTTKSGHAICGFEQVKDTVDLVIIMNRNFYAANKHEIKSRKSVTKTFNLDLYLLMKNATVEDYVE